MPILVRGVGTGFEQHAHHSLLAGVRSPCQRRATVHVVDEGGVGARE